MRRRTVPRGASIGGMGVGWAISVFRMSWSWSKRNAVSLTSNLIPYSFSNRARASWSVVLGSSNPPNFTGLDSSTCNSEASRTLPASPLGGLPASLAPSRGGPLRSGGGLSFLGRSPAGTALAGGGGNPRARRRVGGGVAGEQGGPGADDAKPQDQHGG